MRRARTKGATMRSTLEIEIAVSDNLPATEQELRYALAARCAMYRYVKRGLCKLCDAILADRPNRLLRLKAMNAKKEIEAFFAGQKRPVDEWLGPDNRPDSPEHAKLMASGKALVKRVTGVDLDEPGMDGGTSDA